MKQEDGKPMTKSEFARMAKKTKQQVWDWYKGIHSPSPLTIKYLKELFLIKHDIDLSQY